MYRRIFLFAFLVICLAGNSSRGADRFFEAGVQKLEVPADAPDFTLKALGGGEVSLKGLKGKVVLLNFFSPTCAVCRKEASSFDKLNTALKEKGLILLQIASGVENEEAAHFKKEFKISLPILIDEDGSVAKAYGLLGLHETFFINREGKIVGKTFESGREWTSPEMLTLVRELLGAGK
jgi:peroxiredoxin